ncbi:MAG: hypothetical protein AVDCRST_MAG68-2189 [uncultured Gemmatimonadetes bacterium]|uniref:Uncharacterized protein n=1 Tax=uncultured Gemmatimonadota bacterium TaxID=203437 RepID=A0A6J4L928_9BACT|nr:MAG: hypothetical protein AVDCRST_MAG68-2189 [uncultured Gemmatimonadota bacterium]
MKTLRSVRMALPALLLALAACRDDATSPAVQRPAPAEEPRLAATPAWAEGRALWVTRYEYDTPTKIAAIMQKAADANFNVVYFQVRGSGDAYYRSALEPCSVALCGYLGGTPTWDPLAVAIQEAHARGLQLHAWLNAFSGWGAGASTTCALLKESDAGNPRHMLLAHPEWRVVDNAGVTHPCPNAEEYVYVSPGYAGARTHLARVAADVARRYDVDGVHLDRIRLPGTKWSHDRASLAAFGKDPAAYPADWANFRRSLVNLAVKEVYDSVGAVKPKLAVSGAIWPIYTDKWGWNSSQGYSQYLQDPYAWARGGYFDVGVPMTYYTIGSTYCGYADWACLLDDHLQRLQGSGGRHVYIGIGAKNGAAEVEKQIRLARQQGAKGVSIYSYGTVESNALWTVLKNGVFAQKASLPPQHWKTACCADIIVDNNNTRNNTAVAYAEASSNWTSTTASPGYYAVDYRYASTQSISDPATFWFYLPAGGTRTVSAWWTSGSNRSASAPFIAYDASGTKLGSTAYANQQLNGGKWNAVGTWTFTAGWNKVQLSRWTTAGYIVVGDAIRVQ